jgi:hypothetical protein
MVIAVSHSWKKIAAWVSALELVRKKYIKVAIRYNLVVLVTTGT